VNPPGAGSEGAADPENGSLFPADPEPDGRAGNAGPSPADEETPEALQVHLPAFDGPLDLLLHLIRKNKVNIYDIPIALITEQYQKTLEVMQELDLEIAGEFIYTAALLIHIKSRMLLPRAEGPEAEDDPRRELVDRLLEYRRVKEIAEGLHELETVERGIWIRPPEPVRGKPEVELPLTECSLFDLVEVFSRVVERYRHAHPPALELSAPRFSVKEKMLQVLGRLGDESPLHLLGFLSESPSRSEIVVLFVATLELVRLQVIRLFQAEALGEILLHRTSESFDLDAFEDYYR
jgi:segregation and condensation protein A